MNLIQRIKAAVFAPASQAMTQVMQLNRQVSIYPYGKDLTFINQGYNKNWAVYSIVSKCAKKFSQVPWYHYKIKTSERKTWAEYQLLTKYNLSDPKARMEAKKMKIKSVDQVIVDSPVTKLLYKANRNQSGAEFRESLYGYKLLTGEGNVFLSRPMQDQGSPPNEMFVIPKQHVALVKGSDGLADVQGYKLLLGGQEVPVNKDSLIMWAFANYNFDPINLTHLRGQAPLDAGLLMMQASNEGIERVANMNANQGVAGLVFNKQDNRVWTPEQASWNRKQFNSIVSGNDLAGTLGYMSGEYGYIQFGMSAEQLQLLEQSTIQFSALCAIFDIAPQLFSMGSDNTYENRRQYKRDFIYDNIAVAAYGLRDEFNGKLIPAFNLDRERDVVDCDIMSLPELTADLKEQIDGITKAISYGIMTPNEGRKEIGAEEMPDENLNKFYLTSGLTPLDQINEPIGGSLDAEMAQLDQ